MAPSFKKRLFTVAEHGFTLIELLVVVVIIAVLAAIALPIFMDNTKQVVDASVKSDVRNTVTNVNNWRAQHDAQLPASAQAYAAANGKLATSKGAYVNVSFTSANDYVVCGYNHGGAKYTDYKHAWAFTASTGKFTNLADIGGECINAVHVRSKADDNSGDDVPLGDNSHVVTVKSNPNTPIGTSDGTSGDETTILAYDPTGKTDTTPGDDGSDPGGDDPTTDDPGPSNNIKNICVNGEANCNECPAGATCETPTLTTCPVQQDDAATNLLQGSRISNVREEYFSSQNFVAEDGMDLNVELENGQYAAQVYQTQQEVMQDGLTEYRNWADDYVRDNPEQAGQLTVDNDFAQQLEGQHGHFYFWQMELTPSDTNAALKMQVYDFDTGYTFDTFISAHPQKFTATWNYMEVELVKTDGDGNVMRSPTAAKNATFVSHPAILNTDGNQTTGFMREVSEGSNHYTQYAPKCGQIQKSRDVSRGGSKTPEYCSAHPTDSDCQQDPSKCTETSTSAECNPTSTTCYPNCGSIPQVKMPDYWNVSHDGGSRGAMFYDFPTAAHKVDTPLDGFNNWDGLTYNQRPEWEDMCDYNLVPHKPSWDYPYPDGYADQFGNTGSGSYGYPSGANGRYASRADAVEACEVSILKGNAGGPATYGIQVWNDAVLKDASVANMTQVRYTGDSILGVGEHPFTCKANDPVHIERTRVYSNQVRAYGSVSQQPDPYKYGTSGRYAENGGKFDGKDYWTLTVYEQCDTVKQIAQMRILITYPINIEKHARGGSGALSSMTFPNPYNGVAVQVRNKEQGYSPFLHAGPDLNLRAPWQR